MSLYAYMLISLMYVTKYFHSYSNFYLNLFATSKKRNELTKEMVTMQKGAVALTVE
jgi:hypothetical protein